VAYHALLDRSQAVRLIEDLLSGLKSGKISVEYDQEQLTFEPPEAVNLRIRAGQTHKKESLTIRVSWPRTLATEEAKELNVTSE
jgi:amphi-Trp domain-containing protein